jgi:hypothetical protein
MGTAYVLIRLSIPEDPADSGEWLEENTDYVNLALSLLPFAGIAFLWFIGVVRDRIGQMEDRFFSTVLFGSGLLFLSMIFIAAAMAAGLVATYARNPEQMLGSGIYGFAREVVYRASSVYAIRMSAVFMISLGSIWLRIGTVPRWLNILTLGSALVLLFSANYSLWLVLLFPAWVLIVSVYILVANRRRESGTMGVEMAPEPS